MKPKAEICKATADLMNKVAELPDEMSDERLKNRNYFKRDVLQSILVNIQQATNWVDFLLHEEALENDGR